VLKDGGSKIWLNKTASEIVTDIANKFKLKPVVTQSPVRFGQQSMVGHTYWEKIQELAHRIGYVAQVVGTELHFHPMDTMIDKFIMSIPVLTYQDGDINAGSVYEAQTLDKFKPLIGDHVEHGKNNRKNKTVTGVDPVTGKMYTSTSSPSTVGKNLRAVTKDPLFSEVVPTRMSDSPAVAKAMADAQAQLARWSLPADGAGQGDPRIAPYRTVEINGTGDTSDGFWVITKAEHFMTFDGRYTVTFSCVSDGIGGNKPSAFRPTKATVVPTRNIEHELATAPQSRPTIVKLTGQTPLLKQTGAGFKVTPRRWVGR
jgi:phage protein D